MTSCFKPPEFLVFGTPWSQESAGHQHCTHLVAGVDAGHVERAERSDAEPGAFGRGLCGRRVDRVPSSGLGLSRCGWYLGW